MANKIDITLDAIETKLNTLVPATVKVVTRRIINPFTEHSVPVIGLAISRLHRERGNSWIADVLIMIAANKGGVEADQTVTELVAEVDDKIDELVTAGTAGGMIDTPMWDFWYDAASMETPLQHVGAIGGLRIRVESSLKTS